MKINIRGKFRIGLLSSIIAVFSLAAITNYVQQTVLAASPDDVIITEIMYNPVSDNQDDEFLELYNTTGSPIDLEGWSFTSGIELTFGPGITIASNDYLIVSPSMAHTPTASAEYTPTNLSNGGETITLIDNLTNVIDTVTYVDESPWPSSPDGTGPSLELKELNLDNNDPSNWGASLTDGGTPLAVNSLSGLILPVISNVTDPTNDIAASEAVTITATVTGADTVELIYKTNFGAEEAPLTMFDDGAHGDGAAGDDVYGAEIPGQAQDALVRFKVAATNVDGIASAPSTDEDINFYGYAVLDIETTNAPVLEWYIDDADYTDMRTNHREDNVYLPTVVVYGDDVYDNSLVRIRGYTSRQEDKAAYKFKLPKGNQIQIDGSSIAVNEFTVLADVSSSIASELPTTWWVFGEIAGLDTPDVFPVRIERNGAFEGLYQYIDKYDKEWRDVNNYDSGELYEGGDIVSGTDTLTNLVTFFNDLRGLDRKNPAKKEYLLDNINIPNHLNYMSAISALGMWDNNDNYGALNYYDTQNTGRWGILPWDLDGTFSSGDVMISPYDFRGTTQDEVFISGALWQVPEIKEIYLRRIRTVADRIYGEDGGEYSQRIIDLAELHYDDMELDLAKWPETMNGSRSNQELRLNQITFSVYEKLRSLNIYQSFPWSLPASQTDEEREAVRIEEINPDADDANEFVRLYNAADAAVDVSDWVIEGINYVLPKGSVIPSNGSIYVLKNDTGYRASHTSVLVAGQYVNDLGGSGTLTLKTDADAVIDTENY